MRCWRVDKMQKVVFQEDRWDRILWPELECEVTEMHRGVLGDEPMRICLLDTDPGATDKLHYFLAVQFPNLSSTYYGVSLAPYLSIAREDARKRREGG